MAAGWAWVVTPGCSLAVADGGGRRWRAEGGRMPDGIARRSSATAEHCPPGILRIDLPAPAKITTTVTVG
jgi:hypothetical protein